MRAKVEANHPAGQKSLSQRRLFDSFWDASVMFVFGGLRAVDVSVSASLLESHPYANELFSCFGKQCKDIFISAVSSGTVLERSGID